MHWLSPQSYLCASFEKWDNKTPIYAKLTVDFRSISHSCSAIVAYMGPANIFAAAVVLADASLSILCGHFALR